MPRRAITLALTFLLAGAAFAAPALAKCCALAERSHTVSLEGDVVTTPIRSWLATFGSAVLAAFGVAILGVWLYIRRRRLDEKPVTNP